jgi:RimJ/RimL family protein N-acetyltransferase
VIDSDLKFNDSEFSVRVLEPADVTIEYVNWFSNPDIVKYSSNRFKNFTLEGQIKYVEDMFNSETDILYGIFHKDKHIGNIFYSSIDWNHCRSEVGVLLGYKEYWGKSIMYNCGIESLKLAFGKFPIFKVIAKIYSNNLTSICLTKKVGFSKEGRLKSQYSFGNSRVDMLIYGVILEYGIINKTYYENFKL